MIKDIRDIQELNKISRNIVRGGGNARFRGHSRGLRFQPYMYSRRAPFGRTRPGRSWQDVFFLYKTHILVLISIVMTKEIS
jgi:hypothetical protein